MARLDRDRPVAGDDRLLVAAERLQDDAEVRQRLGRSWIDLVGRGNQLMRLLVAALLIPQHAEQMQRVEMLRIDVEDLAIKQLGSREVAGLVKCERPAELQADIE